MEDIPTDVESACSLQSLLPYMVSNLPVVYRKATSSCHWTLCGNGLEKLAELQLVPVDIPQITPSTSYTTDRYGVHSRVLMTYNEFLKRAHTGNECIYLRDWHIDHVPDVSKQYHVPEAFQDDWLNWYWQRIQVLHRQAKDDPLDDYSFCYVGTPGSFTGTHHDVCLSYSWSANITGIKRWNLWAPEDAFALFTSDESGVHVNAPKVPSFSSDPIGQYLQHLNSESIVSDTRPGHYDPKLYPHLSSCRRKTIIQYPGDIVFVPSGWFHNVENMPCPDSFSAPLILPQTDTSCFAQDTDANLLTISINRNWFNSFNLQSVVAFILREWINMQWELKHLLSKSDRVILHAAYDIEQSEALYAEEVENAMLMDASSWHAHGEVILLANAAINLRMLMELLATRLAMLQMVSYDILDENTRKEFACTEEGMWLSIFSDRFSFQEHYILDDADRKLAALQHSTYMPNVTQTVWKVQMSKLAQAIELLVDTPGVVSALGYIYKTVLDDKLGVEVGSTPKPPTTCRMAREHVVRCALVDMIKVAKGLVYP